MAVPLHERIRNAVADAIREFGDDPVWDNVQAVEVWLPKHHTLPCVSVSFEAGTETDVGGSNVTDLFRFPVLVALHGVGPPDEGENRESTLPMSFRDKIRAAFHRKRLPAVPEVYDCTYEGQPPINQELPQYEKLTTAVNLNFFAEVPRSET